MAKLASLRNGESQTDCVNYPKQPETNIAEIVFCVFPFPRQLHLSLTLVQCNIR